MLKDAMQGQIQFALVSRRRMTGEIVTFYRVDTTRCNQTTAFLFDRAEQPP